MESSGEALLNGDSSSASLSSDPDDIFTEVHGESSRTKTVNLTEAVEAHDDEEER